MVAPVAAAPRVLEISFSPTRLPWMDEVLGGARRFNVPVKGRRAGGTSLCEDLAIELCLRGKRIGWFSLSDKLLTESWDRFVQALEIVTWRKDEGKHRLETWGGGLIEAWSCQAKVTTRSRKYDAVFIDEAAHIDELKRIWEQEVEPSLLDTEGGAWFPSSPNGFGFYHELFERGQDPEHPDWASWQIPTWANPIIKPAEIERLRHELSEISFRQEIAAEFVALEGAVFPDFRRDRHVPKGGIELDPRLPIWLGVDFGYRTFAFVLGQRDKGDLLRLVEEGEWKGLTTPQAIKRLHKYPWADQVEVIACDPAGDGRDLHSGITDVHLFREAFPQARVTYSTAPQHRDPEWRASRLRDRLWSAAGDSRLAVNEKCRRTIAMLGGSRYPKIRPGLGEKQQPLKDGDLDHLRDGLGYLEVALLRDEPLAPGEKRI